MAKFGEIFQDLVIETLKQVYQFVVEAGPKVALALIILLMGWICAVLLGKIVAKLLKAVGFDVLSEKVGLKRFLVKGGVQRNPSSAIGSAFYWLIVFSALVTAFNTLNLAAASRLIQQIAVYVPRMAVALVLLALGIFLSRFVGKFVETTSHLARIPFPTALGKAAGYAVIGLAVMIALEHLGVPAAIIVELFIVIFGVVPLVCSLIFLIGGKNIISGLLAGRLLKRIYKEGEKIEFDSTSGEIVSIDFLTTKIRSDAGEVLIPNSLLAQKIVRKIQKPEKESG